MCAGNAIVVVITTKPGQRPSRIIRYHLKLSRTIHHHHHHHHHQHHHHHHHHHHHRISESTCCLMFAHIFITPNISRFSDSEKDGAQYTSRMGRWHTTLAISSEGLVWKKRWEKILNMQKFVNTRRKLTWIPKMMGFQMYFRLQIYLFWVSMLHFAGVFLIPMPFMCLFTFITLICMVSECG